MTHHRLLRLLKRLRQDRRGAVAAFVGLALPVLAGVGMLGVDAGVWYWERRNIQTAADAGAMAGAWHRYHTSAAGLEGVAQAAATANGATGAVTASNPPVSGPGAGNPAAVEVTVTEPLKLFYARVIGANAASQTVRATAVVELDTNFCILGLDPSLNGAVTVQGTADVTMDCGIAVNSNSDQAVTIGGGAELVTTGMNTVGGFEVNGSPSITSPGGMLGGRPPVQDPYEDLEVPPYSPADCTSVSVVGNTVISPPAPGVPLIICSDIKVNSGDTLHFEAGLYIIAGGQIQVMGGGTLTGDLVDGTTFVLTDAPHNKGQVDIRGGATVELSAPSTGDWAGILFYQDRTSPSFQGSNPLTNKFNGGADLNLKGVVYFPQQAVDFTGGAGIGPGCLHIIGRQVLLNGNGTLNNNCNTAGTRPIAVPTLRLLR